MALGALQDRKYRGDSQNQTNLCLFFYIYSIWKNCERENVLSRNRLCVFKKCCVWDSLQDWPSVTISFSISLSRSLSLSLSHKHTLKRSSSIVFTYLRARHMKPSASLMAKQCFEQYRVKCKSLPVCIHCQSREIIKFEERRRNCKKSV